MTMRARDIPSSSGAVGRFRFSFMLLFSRYHLFHAHGGAAATLYVVIECYFHPTKTGLVYLNSFEAFSGIDSDSEGGGGV
jgi:hypothetical protein